MAGWQRTASGRYAVYARTDQILAGLERAVDPNGDGVAHDAARIAVVGVAEPYSAFADGPLAKAVAGALRLDTLVVAPVGNDGLGASSGALRDYGSVAGPGGAPSALTVGAVDLRKRERDVRVSVRAGLTLAFEGRVPLGGVVHPGKQLSLPLTAPLDGLPAPRRTAADDRVVLRRRRLQQRRGQGRARPGGRLAAQRGRERRARRRRLRSCSTATAPCRAAPSASTRRSPCPSSASRATRRWTRFARFAGARRRRSRSAPSASGRTRASAASPSSRPRGLAFDGRVKPDLVAPGVGIATSEPGSNSDGTSRFGTVNGSSVAAAVVGGAAALLAQARPSLDARSLRSLLANTARRLPDASTAAQGAGLLDLGAATASEFTTTPGSLALGRADDVGWQTATEVVVRNVSTRTLKLSGTVQIVREGAGTLSFSVKPTASRSARDARGACRCRRS